MHQRLSSNPNGPLNAAANALLAAAAALNLHNMQHGRRRK